jgi:hypothetical protein
MLHLAPSPSSLKFRFSTERIGKQRKVDVSQLITQAEGTSEQLNEIRRLTG